MESKTCIVGECQGKQQKLKMCTKHYQRLRKHGDVNYVSRAERSTTGKSKTVNGYVRISGNYDHPKNDNGRVFEHILVMEEKLGRYLLPGENVHHKNGKRDDNTPENLELWVVSQPAGQRPEDLVAWAKEILERYDPQNPAFNT